ncbi:MAG: hypothetical protein HFE66_00940 [Clostridiales bacterium]|jgi:hypothetical protein|nr:hypothetical protein [Clostridiales bacterium]
MIEVQASIVAILILVIAVAFIAAPIAFLVRTPKKAKQRINRKEASFKKTVEDYFESHYKAALAIAKASSIARNPEFELLPAMFIVCDYSAASSGLNRQYVANRILQKITTLCKNVDSKEFDQRCDLYGEIIRGKPIRGEWFHGNADALTNPIAKIATVLGDIWVNPYCADDYDKAPVIIGNNIFEMMEFAENVMLPLIDEFGQLFTDIYSLENM